MEMHSPELGAAFRKLYPALSEDDLKRAVLNFTRYLEIASEIREEKAAQAAAVDSQDSSRIITDERSKRSSET